MFNARILLILLVGLVPVASQAAMDLACDSLLKLPFTVNFVQDANFKAMSPAQVDAVREDVIEAQSFANRVFEAPSYVEVEAQAQNDGALFLGGLKLRLTYSFGTYRNGEFVARGRRHSKSITYHEFGHLIFEMNAMSFEGWARRMSQRLPVPAGYVQVAQNFDALQLFKAYNEFFADSFAAILTQSPRAISAAISNVEHKSYIRGRNFLSQIPVKGWNNPEPHVFLAPARAALGSNPKAQLLFVKKPELLMQLIFESILTEMNRISGEHAEYFGILKVEDINRRLVNELNHRIEKASIY